MLIDEWPIYAAINRREYRRAQEERTRIMRGLLEVINFAGNGTTRSESMEDVRVRGLGQIAGSTRGADAQVAPQSILPGLLQQINERISMIADRQDASGRALERLINPRPVNVTQDKELISKDPNSTEDHLHAIVRRLDAVFHTAADQADKLNSAV